MVATPQTIEKESRWSYLLDREGFLAVTMLAPAVLYILVLVGIPFVMAVLFSFSDITIGDPNIDTFSLASFTRVTTNRAFQQALLNTFTFTIVAQILVIILATTLAVLLTRNFPGKWFVRMLILLPWATPIAIGAIGWLWMLDSVYSPIDYVLRQLHLLGPGGLIKSRSNMVWLGEPGLTMAVVIAVHVWRMLPISTVIIMAGLTSIPQDVKDAVEVDGVGFWRSWFEVTLPLIRPILLVATLFGIIFTFTDMTVVHVLTRGANNTQMLASLAYYTGIDSGNLAEGAATAIFLLPVMFGVALLMLRVASRSEVR